MFKVSSSEDPVYITSYWSGGSRDYYVAVDLGSMQTREVPQNGTPFDGGPIAPDGVAVPPNIVLVQHTIFQGKDHGLTFHVHPQTVFAALEAPKVELTMDQKIVLAATTAFVNTYGGESNIRFKEARRETGIRAEHWEAAKKQLISRKLLNKAGSITIDGRNAIGSVRLSQIKKEIAEATSPVFVPPTHVCEDHLVVYSSDGALGHGWECGICGKFLQAG